MSGLGIPEVHVATPAAGPATQAAPAQAPIPKNATVVSDREARPGKASEESYAKGPDGGKPKLTEETFKEKIAKIAAAKGKKVDLTPGKKAKVEEPAAVEPVVEENPASTEAAIEEGVTEGEGEAIVEAAAEEEGKYKLNPKFKAVGNEYELPKWAQGIIKDEATEKEVKDVFEKAMGLEHVKMRHQELLNSNGELNHSHQEVLGGLDELKGLYAEATSPTGNIRILDDFFGKLKIPQNVILQYAASLVDYMEMPPNQQQLIDAHIAARREARGLSKVNTAHFDRAFQAETQARVMRLNAALEKPDIAPIAQKYDSFPGRKLGDFARRVAEHGEYTYIKSQGKTDLPIEDAVKQVIDMYGLGVQAPNGSPQATGAAPAPAKAGTPPVVPHNPKVPVIPSISGRNTSPTKVKPKNLAELRKMAANAAK